MTETKPLIGVSWEPKLPGLMGASINNDKKFSDERGCSALWKPNSDLVDGPYVPPKDPAKLKKLIRKQDKDTLGKDWYVGPSFRFLFFLFFLKSNKFLFGFKFLFLFFNVKALCKQV
uniref:Uncharacterized protein n=1 Tax=Rhizophora mucronata TaxID=61149 RepID=A0A2P2LYT2_RHIMU